MMNTLVKIGVVACFGGILTFMILAVIGASDVMITISAIVIILGFMSVAIGAVAEMWDN